MTSLVFLIEQTALGMYVLVGVGVLLSARRLLRASSAFRATHFELERDLARYERANAVTVLILLLEAGLVIVGIQQVVAPTLRAELNIAAPIAMEDGVFNTPVPVLSENTEIDASGINLTLEDPSQRVLATPTLTPTPVGTIMPNAAASVGCDMEGASLQIPANGMRVFEAINIVGVANVADFAFYRFEINGPQTQNVFATLAEYTQPVTEQGVLGQFVPSFYQPGWYQFRVTVFDSTNTLGPSCMVNILISEPVPTATPIGQ